MPSFDIISELDIQELDNAVNQAKKELQGRYDLKGSKYEVQWDRKTLVILAEDDYKLNAIKDILLSKAHRRGIDIRALSFEKAEPAGGMMWRQPIKIMQGIEKETAKKIVKEIKDSGLKVQAAINNDLVRVTSKSIDTLQECMSLMRKANMGIPLQFTNLR